MILLNFSHPITPKQLQQLEGLLNRPVEHVVSVPAQIDPQQPLLPQVLAIVDACGLSPEEWQTLPLLVNPPALNIIAVTLLAELHGRCGYFPAHVRLRPVQGAVPVEYEVAEVLDLQAIRDGARLRRSGNT